MKLTVEQTKGRIKRIANENNADARVLLRLYMMERFLERLSLSKYRNNFIIKGGILVTSLVGVSLRSTMDIDTSMRGQNLNPHTVRKILSEIIEIDAEDGITFQIKSFSTIMDEMDYPGVRVTMNAHLDKIDVPLKIDVSTDDVITPEAVEHQYKMMLEDGNIELLSYNLETVLAEKMQTILARGALNTRMRDFYDVRILLQRYMPDINRNDLKKAFKATCCKRGTEKLLGDEAFSVLEFISSDASLKKQWFSYSSKYPYATDVLFEDVIGSLEMLLEMINKG